MYIPQVQDLNIFVILVVTFSCSVTAYFWISPCLNHFDFIVYKSLASTWLQYFPKSDLSVLVQYVVWNRTDLFPMWCLLDRAQTHLVSTWRCYSAPRKTISVRIPRKISLGRRSFLVLRCCILHLKLDEMPVALKCNFNVKLNVFGYIFRLSSWGFSIEYYGGGREFLANKQQGSCYLWMSFCGLAPAAKEAVVWGRAAGGWPWRGWWDSMWGASSEVRQSTS